MTKFLVQKSKVWATFSVCRMSDLSVFWNIAGVQRALQLKVNTTLLIKDLYSDLEYICHTRQTIVHFTTHTLYNVKPPKQGDVSSLQRRFRDENVAGAEVRTHYLPTSIFLRWALALLSAFCISPTTQRC